ncbi:chemotaxis protein CheW [Ureibacillus thermosphaericus]|uniref:Purine-binding chemotaxis protein CheW n=1 Tax=Ureibacillus thermosphaericus TaxID=51173 RepID=A0A840PWK4_URETH|nr:chemotaxis protein CheW [Ureibacillus thermosphaericus]MBB5149674.1 purine-binding chemotaxis protein CheW [Ureibacillus thermosphaericus]NKZ32469.1 chemotaxis protein CheW [Ureibacillus thermosphaericus]
MKCIDQIDENQFVVFSLNEQLYAFSIEEVVEILRVPSITSIPGINPNIEGVINLRGNIIPVVNLHKRFQLPIPNKNKKNRIVIVQGKNENIGLLVDKINMVTRFDEEHVEPNSNQTLEEDVVIFFAKHKDQVIGVLNLEKVLYENHQVS